MDDGLNALWIKLFLFLKNTGEPAGLLVELGGGRQEAGDKLKSYSDCKFLFARSVR
jgi:hypothetical protein